MNYWLLYAIHRVLALALLTATALFVVAMPAAFDPSLSHYAPLWAPWFSTVTGRAVVACVHGSLIAFGWFAVVMAARHMGRPE